MKNGAEYEALLAGIVMVKKLEGEAVNLFEFKISGRTNQW